MHEVDMTCDRLVDIIIFNCCECMLAHHFFVNTVFHATELHSCLVGFARHGHCGVSQDNQPNTITGIIY